MQQLSQRFSPYILIVAIVAAAVVYFANRYSSLTLVLEQRTTATGAGKVYWDSGGGFNEKDSMPFTVADSQNGGWRICTVHLPASAVIQLRIIPSTGQNGTTETKQISLLSDCIQYTLLENGSCLQRQLGNGQARTEACFGNYPRVTMNGDSSLIVSNIPAWSIERPHLGRAVLGGGCFLFFLFGGLWLFRYQENTSRLGTALHYLERMAWLGLVFYYLWTFYQLSRFAVDVPYIDEWHYFDQNALPKELTWNWLIAFHNEHRIPFTKLMAWLNLKLFGLDFAKQQLANFILYGVLIAAVARLKKKILGDSFRLFPVFLFFLLSPLNYENHLWGFQSQFHLTVFFALLAMLHAFEEHGIPTDYFLFAAFMLLAAYSFSAGVIISFVLLLCQAAFIFSEAIEKRPGLSPDLHQLLVPAAVIAIGLACWFIGYQRPVHHPPLALPFTWAFWDYFLNVISCAFGFTVMSAPAGFACLALVTTPLVVLWLRNEPSQKSGRWKITSAIMTILVVFAVISMGRSGIGEPKSSRYTEFGLLLIPFASMAWYMAISQLKLRSCILALFWLFCTWSSATCWTDELYRNDRVNKLSRLQCIESYFNGTGDGNCEEEIKIPISDYIDAAASLETRFTRQFTGK